MRQLDHPHLTRLEGNNPLPRSAPGASAQDRPGSQNAERLLSVEDVSTYLGVSERWVYDQVRSGRLPAMYIARSWRLRPQAVDAFAESFHWRPVN
jgi:excisionase family DNA binding protein